MSSVDKFVISDEQANALISYEEGHFGDVKSAAIKPSKLTKTVSALANASGGEIYLGINEREEKGKKTRSWLGFSDMEDANAHIQVVADMKPLGGHCKFEFLQCESHTGHVLKIEVFKTNEIVSASDGIPYLRKGASSIPVTDPQSLERLKLDKGIISFEDERINIPAEGITNSTVILEFLISEIPTAEPDAWLRKQYLLFDDKPTVAGTLLFHEEPQAALPKRSAVKVYRYKTKEQEGTRDTLAEDPITVEGPIYSLIYSSVQKVKEIIESIMVVGDANLEKISYPDETLHEIITNAVLHRDYSLAADIQIRIFDNRVEVHSPGSLPGHITKQNILNEQAARNPKLVRLINKFPNPPNKDVGEGLNTAFNAMKALKLKEPEIEEVEGSVVVFIRHARLASPEQAVMEYLDTHDDISNSVARELTGIPSENAMKNVFYALRDRKMLEQVPEKKGNKAAWRKP